MDNPRSQLLFLRSWWSRTYSRPLKDPLLQEYTLEELYYEYRDSVERRLAAEEAAEEASDTIEQNKLDNAMAWAEAEEEKELAKEAQSLNDQEWMSSVIDQAKLDHGEDFGEDLKEDFDD